MPARKSRPLTPAQARGLAGLAAALKQADADFGGKPKLRHAHMLVQSGIIEAGSVPEGDGYPIETWEQMEVTQFRWGRPGYGMIYNTVDNMSLTEKGRGALEQIVRAFEG